MKTLDNETKATLRKTQAVLTKISTKTPVFFNIVQYVDQLGLVKEHGKTRDNKTNWILTEKGQRLLNFQI